MKTTWYVTNLHMKFPNHVICKHLCVHECQLEGSVLFGANVWPVPLTLLPKVLLEVGYHSNSLHPLLPDQPPEVSNGNRKGSWVGVKGYYVNNNTQKYYLDKQCTSLAEETVRENVLTLMKLPCQQYHVCV